MRYYMSDDDINQPQIDWLKDNGYHIYGVRDADDGSDINIEDGFVLVNRIGLLITDTELSMPDGFITGKDFYARKDIEEMRWDEIKEPFEKFKNTNFHFRITGRKTEKYWMWRTYDISIAKQKLKKVMQNINQEDPTARAYQFGQGKYGNFRKIYHRISERSARLASR